MHKTKSELWGDAISDPLLSSIERFQEAASKYPDNIALVCAHQDANLYGIPSTPYWDQEYGIAESASYLRWTYKSLQAGIDRLTAGLRAQGVKQGTAIITLLPNCAEFCLTWWAAMQLGAVMAPLDPRRLSNHEEVSHMLKTIIGEAAAQPPVVIAYESQYLQATAISSIATTARIVVRALEKPSKNDVISFRELMALQQREDQLKIVLREGLTDLHDGKYRDCSIVFTSGSTSLPKGVRRCYPLQTIATSATFDDPGFQTLPGDLWCAVAPNNHTVGTATMISPMANGAGVVYSGASFSAESTAEILKRERCSHILLIPTMVKMIADVMRDRGQGRTNLKALMIAASPPTADTLSDAFEVLGTRGVCVRYGSTEGIACTSKIARSAEEMLGKDGQTSVGGPARGTGVKICDPDLMGQDKPALPRGVAGEIHFSAPFSLPSLYIGQEDKELTCYVDNSGNRWFVTGDQGVIDDEGSLYVVGRYKDLIIRGGENISPLAMELCLASNPKLGANVMQVVGQPDEVAGEAPVVIIGGDFDTKKLENEIRQTIAREMGLMWVPHEIIHLKDLGLQEWPRTALGKLSKLILRKLVHQRYQDNLESARLAMAAKPEEKDHEHWSAHIVTTWARALGVDNESLALHAPVSEFADSLTIARVRGQIRREIPGQERLSARDMAENETVAKQINLVLRMLSGDGDAADLSEMEASKKGPPEVEDMVRLADTPSRQLANVGLGPLDNATGYVRAHQAARCPVDTQRWLRVERCTRCIPCPRLRE
jgi:acyl-CoA synthetase (AMP-forming)/AMP-acid ligase II